MSGTLVLRHMLRPGDVTCDERTHKAGLMAEILEETSLLEGRNILVDGSMRDGEWYAQHVADLRRRFPWLRVAIIHVSEGRMYGKLD